MSEHFELDIAGLLEELSATQGELLSLLTEKRTLLASGDHAGLQSLVPREEQLVARLQACHQRRGELLAQAADEGLPADSIRSLTRALPSSESDGLSAAVKDARQKARILQHQSLTNWVITQRTLLHLSQMIEIIATGGQLRPTYGDGPAQAPSGALVDRAV